MNSGDHTPWQDSTDKSLWSLYKHRHRRWTLKCLVRADEALHLADLARDVARIEAPRRGETGVYNVAESLYVELYHNHVPRLEAAGVVSFDRESRVVSLTVETDDVLASLQRPLSPRTETS